MKKAKSILWGIVLIAAGVLYALNVLNVVNIDIFFDGWWTLFLILPCGIGLITEREKTGNAIGLLIGVLLLLGCRDVIDFDMVWKLILPVVIIILGCHMIFRGLMDGKTHKIISEMKANGKKPYVGCAIFSGCDMRPDGDVFEGAELTAVFGGVSCDLSNAVIEKDCAINVCAVFGGVDILVGSNVNVKVNTTCIFGGVSNKTVPKEGVPTVYVSGICLFGGVDVK